MIAPASLLLPQPPEFSELRRALDTLARYRYRTQINLGGEDATFIKDVIGLIPMRPCETWLRGVLEAEAEDAPAWAAILGAAKDSSLIFHIDLYVGGEECVFPGTPGECLAWIEYLVDFHEIMAIEDRRGKTCGSAHGRSPTSSARPRANFGAWALGPSLTTYPGKWRTG